MFILGDYKPELLFGDNNPIINNPIDYNPLNYHILCLFSEY